MAISRTFETYRLPLKANNTVSVAAGATATAVITVPEDDLYFCKDVTVTAGANITIDDISIDGVTSGEVTTFNTENVFGAILSAWNEITVTGTNAGAAAEDLTISIVGYTTAQ